MKKFYSKSQFRRASTELLNVLSESQGDKKASNEVCAKCSLLNFPDFYSIGPLGVCNKQ